MPKISVLLFAIVSWFAVISSVGAHEAETAPKPTRKAAYSAQELQLIRGAAEYRQCYYCHSLSPGVRLTGPSLANLWNKKAARVAGFSLYSDALKKSDVTWNETGLKGFITNPSLLVPGTSMTFKGVQNPESREALLAFLKIALAPDGFAKVQKLDLLDRETALGQLPKDLRKVAAANQVTAMTYCEGVYKISTADGGVKSHWEENIHLKVDASETGPPKGKAAQVETGSMGDRFAIVFQSLSEAAALIKQCPGRD